MSDYRPTNKYHPPIDPERCRRAVYRIGWVKQCDRKAKVFDNEGRGYCKQHSELQDSHERE